ncbi:MAG: hypothetical protein J4G14_09215 [Dehalococcoidia bacterium]|nr:hypothetical protein [Dehalococcoidia bacterium]
MKYTFQYSLEIDFQSHALQLLPEAAGMDFTYLDQLLDSLSELISNTTWPRSLQGEFLNYVTLDVYEFGYAIRTEAAAGRWTVAVSLMRPLQERSEYALAAAIDPSFSEDYLTRLNTLTEEKFSRQHRGMVEGARGKIDQWVKKSHGIDGHFEASRTLNKVGSEMLHHAIGLSREHEEIAKARPELLKMATGRVLAAVAIVLLAIKVIGEADTSAWRKTSGIVNLLQANGNCN